MNEPNKKYYKMCFKVITYFVSDVITVPLIEMTFFHVGFGIILLGTSCLPCIESMYLDTTRIGLLIHFFMFIVDWNTH